MVVVTVGVGSSQRSDEGACGRVWCEVGIAECDVGGWLGSGWCGSAENVGAEAGIYSVIDPAEDVDRLGGAAGREGSDDRAYSAAGEIVADILG